MHAKIPPRVDNREPPSAKRVPHSGKARSAAAEAAYEEPRHGQSAEDENEPHRRARRLEVREDGEDEREDREPQSRHRQDAEEGERL